MILEYKAKNPPPKLVKPWIIPKKIRKIFLYIFFSLRKLNFLASKLVIDNYINMIDLKIFKLIIFW